MKKILAELLAFGMIPWCASAVSLQEINYNPERYINIGQAGGASMYVDAESVQCYKYNPPYYTLFANIYLIEYDLSCIARLDLTINYDYTRSTRSLIGIISNRYGSSVWTNNPTLAEDAMISEMEYNTGMTSYKAVKCAYNYNGDVIQYYSNTSSGTVRYRSVEFDAGNYMFKKYYNEYFFDDPRRYGYTY